MKAQSPPTDTKGIEISPSRLRLYRDNCERRWAAPAVCGEPKEPSSEAQKFGTRMHKVGQDWYQQGQPPNQGTTEGKLYAAGMHLLPKPGPNVFAEEAVSLPPVEWSGGTYVMPGTADLVEIQGKKGSKADERCGILYDYKTCKDPKWIPSVEDLLKDAQVNLYGLATMLRFNLKWIRCCWIYFIKTGTPRAIPVEFTLTIEDAQKFFDACKPAIRAMREAHAKAEAGPLNLFDFAPRGFDAPERMDYSFCNSYNKLCPHYYKCEQNKTEQAMVDASKLFKKKPATEEKARPNPPAEEKPEKGEPGGGAGSAVERLKQRVEARAAQVNAPEGAAPPPPPETEAKDKPKKKRGRPKKAAAPKAEPSVPKAAPKAEPSALEGLIVFVNCGPTTGEPLTPLRELASEAMEEAAAAENKPDWRLIDFRAGEVLAYYFERWLEDNQPSGRIYVDRFSSEGKALTASLDRFADLVVKPWG